ESRSARLKLSKGKRHSARVGEGVILKYRRTEAGFGTWSAKIALAGGTYALKVLGSADDTQEANGVDVLTFFQAQDKARALAHASKVDAGVLGAGPLTLRQAIERYADNRESRKHAAADRDRLLTRLSEKLLSTAVPDLTKTALERWHRGLVEEGDDD